MEAPDVQILEDPPQIMTSSTDVLLIEDALILPLQPDCLQSAFDRVKEQQSVRILS